MMSAGAQGVPFVADEMGESTRPLVRVEELYAGWNGGISLFGVSLDFPLGSVTALVGPNGAGKSTLSSCIAGTVPYRDGIISLSDQRVDRLAAHARARRGIAVIPESRGLFPNLTVTENLRLGALTRAKTTFRWLHPDEIFDRFGALAARRNVAASNLSGGEQQLLAIVKTLLASPEFLLVDEPSQGLSPVAVELVYSVLLDAVAKGLTLAVVEQEVSKVIEYCDRCAVLRAGKVVYEGTGKALQALSSEELLRLYWGAPS